ncbi:hypothetical protein DFP72DRAFT_905907 [Ephemerocybe angulata]|uniref:F-box domain-containing protein n=1 Tax=Ephemerocybe angulata TaxID=980116 RepID=A0A8H6HSV6_9AGAR|nr:hypothetical protein DFP72DRAFT_905907 [Tulosesus angulatus]
MISKNGTMACPSSITEVLSTLPPLTKLPTTLLHSGCFPSNEERASVEQTIAGTKTSLSIINEEITRLKSCIALLEAHRQDVEANMATHQAVLSPIRHIPSEILAEIFLYATSDTKMSWPHRPEHKADRTPWHLAEVCSYWRSIILSLPTIWSTIHVDLFSTYPIHISYPCLTQRFHDFIDTCLDRSKNAPLSLSLRTGTPWTRSSQGVELARELVCSALVAIVAVSDRWQALSLELKDLFSFHTLLSPARDRVGCLRSLHLASSGHSATTPRVRKRAQAEVSLTHISQPTRHIRLPWHQLKCLQSKGNHFHEGEFTRLLNQTASLEEFKSEDERVLDLAAPTLASTQDATTTSAVHLPHLRTLSISNKGSYISRIFQLFTTPSLTSLSIHSRTAYNAEHTIAMLRRSSCVLNLRTLNLESSRDLEAVWEENYGIVCLLAETRGVEECALRVSKSADEIIPRLTARRGMGGNPLRSPVLSTTGSGGFGGYGAGAPMSGQGGVLLPNLRVFSLEDSYCESAEEMVEMVESRLAPCTSGGGGSFGGLDSLSLTAHLSEVNLNLSRPAPPTYEELGDLKAAASKRGCAMKFVG